LRVRVDSSEKSATVPIPFGTIIAMAWGAEKACRI
jgi:hypothetical protein